MVGVDLVLAVSCELFKSCDKSRMDYEMCSRRPASGRSNKVRGAIDKGAEADRRFVGDGVSIKARRRAGQGESNLSRQPKGPSASRGLKRPWREKEQHEHREQWIEKLWTNEGERL